MSEVVIRVENLYKEYRLGTISHGTLSRDLQSWWANLRGKEDPNSLVSSSYSEKATDTNKRFYALKDISFDVKQGEIVGIIGRNGAGKSTLLKIMSKVTAPTRGTIKVKGRIASLLEVGTGFHPELTGRENIYLNGTILGMKRKEIDTKYEEIVDFAEIKEFVDTPVKRYSSGMHVRLAFAVAAHLEPEILLVDEVLAVGDVAFQKKCLGKMGEITDEGRTILFVSHNMPAIESLCHRAILLEDGQITFRGDSVATVAHYLGKKDLTVDSFRDLRTHPGRTTKSKPIFQSIRILKDQGDETAIIQVGDGVIFEMVLEATEHKLKSPRILIVVSDTNERQIARFYSYDMMTDPFEIVERTFIRCYWNSCRLAPGKYIVSLKLRVLSEILDTIIGAITIEVMKGDVYGTGKLDERAGVIIPEGNWEFKSVLDTQQVIGVST